jgi:CDP-glycerol glycerophosphotransferase
VTVKDLGNQSDFDAEARFDEQCTHNECSEVVSECAFLRKRGRVSSDSDELDYYIQRAERAEKHAAVHSCERRRLEQREARLAENVIELYRMTQGGVSGAIKRRLREFKHWLSVHLSFGEAAQKQKIRYRNTRLVEKSSLFDAEWYLRENPDVPPTFMSMAAHYYLNGWKEGREPSPGFSNDDYFELNPIAEASRLCPLLHWELYGKYDGRLYSYEHNTTDDVPPMPLRLRFDSYRKLKREIAEGKQIPVQNNKIIFRTYQGVYTCNPKYICNRLLEESADYDIVWLCKAGVDQNEFPGKVRCVPVHSSQAKQEIASAKILIDNGVHFFRDARLKKKNQISVCTWHGSLGFKTLTTEAITKREQHVRESYENIYDYVISNSLFEDEVYRNSHWPKNEILRLGHARNDILFTQDQRVLERIRNRVLLRYNIDPDKKLILYAPTFRQAELHAPPLRSNDEARLNGGPHNDNSPYYFDYDKLRQALRERFGGEWVILIRQHFVNVDRGDFHAARAEHVVNVADYPDIQELMVAADVGLTDYSSWLPDFMFTRKPGFVFALDLDDYAVQRGFCYPIEQAPFPVAKSQEELFETIRNFDQVEYEKRIVTFLEEKGSMEDGRASERIVAQIHEWTRNA